MSSVILTTPRSLESLELDLYRHGLVVSAATVRDAATEIRQLRQVLGWICTNGTFEDCYADAPAEIASIAKGLEI